MHRFLCLLIVATALLVSRPSFADAPHQIAGFALGANISHYQHLLRMDSVLPIRHMEYLSEVETKPIEGYKNGYILFGNCREPGRILKIKMKYMYADREFYDRLLSVFKKKFGPPSEWRGDAFQTLISWKWSFTDKEHNKISMILQHYTGDDEEYTSGNSLKISLTSAIEKERQCYEMKEPASSATARKQKPQKTTPGKDTDLSKFIPE
jgi:hypothetical protein